MSVKGGLARSIMARGIRASAYVDNHVWAIRSLTVLDPGNPAEQPITQFTDARIYPVISEINEYEAAAIGQNVRAGDLKLIVDGFTIINETTMLVCDGEKCDVYRSPAAFNVAVEELRTIYVRRPKERRDV
jgi:hypothetical protein